ncbi:MULTISPECIES: type I restriction endonuclease subunit R [Calothrix]|uniref:Type I restriction endonuclease subunit R n=2 Tax=Calothrix TaxID=1186 RepID=A0ABR8AEF8_9CYAN|nr:MULTISPECIES: type I restriction endonuclease subunit R [Calothrix]MBD2198144.1 type I restriction endonuclease subunit R [Calothrix parietina FACHB-288]MBD2227310.1 type I restriction endonuclease subunit R [Calothrix anomala FACHB-343]
MVKTLGITKAITNLNEVHNKFNLIQTSGLDFFTEWCENLPELSESEKAYLNRLKSRYLYYAADGAITEGTINIIMLSPLLELIGLCDPPFKIKSEELVKVEILNAGAEELILEGFIDALVVKNRFWVVLIESKRYGFSVMQALPQTLTYMMANPNREIPIFGLITNGEDYIFVKLNQQQKCYALSNKFTLSNPHQNEMYDVMRVMKQIISFFE